MPRHPRVHASGLLYHVMARGNNGQKIFSQAKDYEVFLEQLQEARRRYPFYLYADVLTPNHFHLLLEVMELPMARIMQSLLAKANEFRQTEPGRIGLYRRLLPPTA